LGGTFKKSFALTMSPFVFSNKTAPRLARHLAFWGLYFACTIVTYLPSIGAWTQISRQQFSAALFETFAYLPVYLLSMYGALYFMLPRYLARRNIGFLAFYIFLLLALSISSGYFITKLIFKTNGYSGDNLDVLSMALQRCMADLITITGAAIILKTMKDYFLEQRKNEILVLENIRNKLQLQKMQMHPRLLFASLHRIQMEIDTDTQQAAEMILKLSDLLSYLLYESESERVPLSREARMIKNYIALKKLENADSVDILFQTDGQLSGLSIPPGLLLSLLEIGIEGLGARPQKTWVAIEIRTAADEFYFSIISNRPGNEIANDLFVLSTIQSVKERLQSSYFQRFKLGVYPDIDHFKITLQVTKDHKSLRSKSTKAAKT
jgi:sensor histidine kinase YesM